jgi:hypothetical protein
MWTRLKITPAYTLQRLVRQLSVQTAASYKPSFRLYLYCQRFFSDQGHKFNKKGSEEIPVPNPASANIST